MNAWIRNIIIIIILSLPSGCFGYCYEIFVYDKIDKSTGKSQRLIMLSDYHLKSDPSNKEQRIYIESLLEKHVDSNIILIVEDLSSVNNDGKMMCCHFGINCSTGMLGQLADKARKLGIQVYNIEYRYCRVAGFAPLLNNSNEKVHSFKSSSTITMASIYQEIMEEIAKVEKYDDGKFLNNFYKNAIAKIQAALLKNNFDNQNVTVADYCALLPSKHYRHKLEKLCIFDSVLIDMNIIHTIVSCAGESVIVVIAGGSHIQQVNTLLKRIGYKSVMKKKSAEDIYPAPVNVAIIEKFIP